MKKIAFIGCGNMAKAMIGGIVAKNLITPEEIIASNRSSGALEKVKARWGICITTDNKEAAKQAEIIVLAIKPQFYPQVIDEIKDEIDDSRLIISIAAGKTLNWLAGAFGRDLKFFRCNPNTPALVGAGITSVTPAACVTKEELGRVMAIMESFGAASVVPEAICGAVTAVAGSSPAYVFMFIEAMADSAVSMGMPRKQAYTFAAQAVMGSAKLMIETGMHPGELKDMVCSPGGTTIQAVRKLEEKGFRSSVMEAMQACFDKANSL